MVNTIYLDGKFDIRVSRPNGDSAREGRQNNYCSLFESFPLLLSFPFLFFCFCLFLFRLSSSQYSVVTVLIFTFSISKPWKSFRFLPNPPADFSSCSHQLLFLVEVRPKVKRASYNSNPLPPKLALINFASFIASLNPNPKPSSIQLLFPYLISIS